MLIFYLLMSYKLYDFMCNNFTEKCKLSNKQYNTFNTNIMSTVNPKEIVIIIIT